MPTRVLLIAIYNIVLSPFIYLRLGGLDILDIKRSLPKLNFFLAVFL